MTLLPLLYALLAALTGFSAEAGPVRERQVAAASVAAGGAVAAVGALPQRERAYLARVDLAARIWRERVGFAAWYMPVAAMAAVLPSLERPARRRE